MTQNIILTRGLPGSGKSTYAIKWVDEDPTTRARVNRDDIRYELYGEYVMKNDKRGSVKDKENHVTEVQHSRLKEALAAGKSVIVDDTNLNPRSFQTFSKLANEHNVGLSNVDFPIDIDECIRRNNNRDRVVPEHIIRGMASKCMGSNGEFHLFPNTYPVKEFVKPATKRHAIIFDADGTLVDVRGIRHYVRGKWRDFDSFHRSSLFSPPVQSVVDMAFDADREGYAVIVVTAREDKYRDVTQAWLDKHAVPYENIYMRPTGDSRKDSIVKEELLERILEDYDVVHAVDDNPAVKEVWHNANILTTVVPGFAEGEIDEYEPILIKNLFRSGGCLRCGQPLKSGETIGPRCKTKM